jgi:hypothetical protein
LTLISNHLKHHYMWHGKHRRPCCWHLDRFVNWFNFDITNLIWMDLNIWDWKATSRYPKLTPKPFNSPLCTSISLINFMKQYSFKITEPSLNNISKFCQVADQLLQQNIERWFFFVSRLQYFYHLLYVFLTRA